MAIENSVSNDFLSTFIDSINVFDCHLSSVVLTWCLCGRNMLLIFFSATYFNVLLYYLFLSFQAVVVISYHINCLLASVVCW